MGILKKTDVEVITFKADKELMRLLKAVPNRSEFIRTALLVALDNLCPFCRGTGVLTPHRKKHWDDLAAHHDRRECRECNDQVLVCSH